MSLHSSIPRIPFTQKAYESMQFEYQKLLIEQDELISRISIARAQGDLSENGAYKYGKIELSSVRHRLRELKHLISHGKIITTPKKVGTIQFGAEVKLVNEDKKIIFTLVSQYESDPTKMKLSDKSPYGAAVIGKNIGEQVIVNTPLGEKIFTISSASYPTK